MRVLIFGDSITQGFWDTGGGWVARLRKYYDTLALKDLHSNNQPEIFNLGVSGDTTFNLLARIEPEIKAREWPDDPMIAVVAIGANDDLFENGEQRVKPDEFRANIRKIIAIVNSLVKNIILVGNAACIEELTTPVFWADIHYTNEQMQKYEQIIKEVAAEHKVMFIPIFEEFKKRLDTGEDLLADGLHPNSEGHELIFNTVRPELDKLLNSQNTL